MTTPVAAAMYEAEHMYQHRGRKVTIFNPSNKPESELPIIYGFNNGGSHGWMQGVLISENGYVLGGHTCSTEAYMLADLGIIEGTRSDRHDTFQKLYPEGYKMEFVGYDNLVNHVGLNKALSLQKEPSLDKIS